MFKTASFLAIILSFTACGGGSTSDAYKYANDLQTQNSSTSSQNSNNMQAQSVVVDIPQISESEKTEFLDAINSARAETQDCGVYGVFPPVKPLTWSDSLYKAAYEHTRDMAVNGVVEHDGTNSSSDTTAKSLNLGRGSYFYERAKYNGYTDYQLVEENVAGGTYFNSAQDAVDAWLDSDGHCANLMNKDIKDVGMAHVKEGTKYTNYWSQEFGVKH